ncbi:MAG TPA: hypothetical protein VHO72_03040 [Bacteroidales bacterium]|nr:hypothetical protein [Bacteroidales bacterium]
MGNNSAIFQIIPFFTGTAEDIPNGSFVKQHVSFSINKDVQADAIIIGLPDNDQGNDFSIADRMRKELYRLTSLTKNLNILDLGNLKCGDNIGENIETLYKVLLTLHQLSVKIVLLGGNAHLQNKVIFNFYKIEQYPLNYVDVNSIITWDNLPIDPLTTNPVSSVSQNQLNYVNMGFQLYYVEKEVLEFLHDANFDSYRLGLVRNNIAAFEPIVRDANVLNISLNSVKYSDAPAARFSSPNGLSGDEMCQLAFYGGYSSSLKIFNISDMECASDPRNITSVLASQALWYLFEGFANNTFEDPGLNPENFTKYHIHIDMANQDLAFYYSTLTQRWWMEVSLESEKRKILVSCNASDYELACKQEIPERWWRLFNRV